MRKNKGVNLKRLFCCFMALLLMLGYSQALDSAVFALPTVGDIGGSGSTSWINRDTISFDGNNYVDGNTYDLAFEYTAKPAILQGCTATIRFSFDNGADPGNEDLNRF